MGLVFLSILTFVVLVIIGGTFRFRTINKVNQEEAYFSPSRRIGKKDYVIEVEDMDGNLFLVHGADGQFKVFAPLETDLHKGMLIKPSYFLVAPNVSPEFIYSIVTENNFPLYTVEYQKEQVLDLLEQHSRSRSRK